MDPKTVCLRSPYAPAECARWLAAVVDANSAGLGSWLGLGNARENPVIGTVTGTSVQLTKRIPYRNSFQTHLDARLQAEGMGTVIVGTVGSHPLVRAFMIIWLVAVALIGIPVALALARDLADKTAFPRGGDGWMPSLIPPAMLVFGVCLCGFGRLLARGEGNFLVGYVARTLDAETVPDP